MAGLSDLFSGGLGILGSFLNANQARHNEDFYRSEGDPYRSQLRAISADPSLYYNGPEAKSLANMVDQRYSSQFGNPAGSGTAQALASDALLRGLGAEKDRLFKMGGGDYLNAGMVPGANAKGKAYQGVFGSLQDMLKILSGGGGGGGGGGVLDAGSSGMGSLA